MDAWEQPAPARRRFTKRPHALGRVPLAPCQRARRARPEGGETRTHECPCPHAHARPGNHETTSSVGYKFASMWRSNGARHSSRLLRSTASRAPEQAPANTSEVAFCFATATSSLGQTVSKASKRSMVAHRQSSHGDSPSSPVNGLPLEQYIASNRRISSLPPGEMVSNGSSCWRGSKPGSHVAAWLCGEATCDCRAFGVFASTMSRECSINYWCQLFADVDWMRPQGELWGSAFEDRRGGGVTGPTSEGPSIAPSSAGCGLARLGFGQSMLPSPIDTRIRLRGVKRSRGNQLS